MKNLPQKFLALLAFLFVFGFSAKAQADNKAAMLAGPRAIFEFKVTGMNSQQDAIKLDSAMMKGFGIFKSETDYNHKSCKVTLLKDIPYRDIIMVIVRVNGFEASDEHTVTDIAEQH
jgi:hypothetical protein